MTVWFWSLSNVEDLADWLIAEGVIAASDRWMVDLFPRSFDADWEAFQAARAAA